MDLGLLILLTTFVWIFVGMGVFAFIADTCPFKTYKECFEIGFMWPIHLLRLLCISFYKAIAGK